MKSQNFDITDHRHRGVVGGNELTQSSMGWLGRVDDEVAVDQHRGELLIPTGKRTVLPDFVLPGGGIRDGGYAAASSDLG
jgi:hypothetical protein